MAGSCFRFPAEVNALECQAQMQEALVAFSHTKSYLSILQVWHCLDGRCSAHESYGFLTGALLRYRPAE